MAKIVINIDMDELKSGINQVVDDDMYEMEEEEFVCPLSTQDSKLNSENREYAIKEHSYGASENRKKCAELAVITALSRKCLIA